MILLDSGGRERYERRYGADALPCEYGMAGLVLAHFNISAGLGLFVYRRWIYCVFFLYFLSMYFWWFGAKL